MEVIELPFAKLIESLVDRKVLPMKWQDQVRKVEGMIDHALSEYQEQVKALKTLPHENLKSLNYFQCREILKLLEESHEGKSTNFLGQYTTPILNDWYSIQKAFEKSNVYLGDSSRSLIQMAREIPLLKESISTNEKQVTENNRRVSDCSKQIIENQRKLSQACANLGITDKCSGTKTYEAAISALVAELPHKYHEIIVSVCDSSVLSEALEYYTALQEHLHDVPDVKKKKQITKNIYGFDYICQLKNAAADSSSTTTNVESTIDNIETEVDAEIVWEDDVNPSTEEEISWDITTTGGNDDDEIVWDISCEETTSSLEDATKLGLISRVDFRNKLKNDLMELEAFFSQRIDEVNSTDAVLALANNQATTSVKALMSYREVVQRVLDLLDDKRFLQLVMLEDSQRYVERLATSLYQFEAREDKYKDLISNLKMRNAELVVSVSDAHAKIESLSKATAVLKLQLEEALSKHFKGYKVCISM